MYDVCEFTLPQLMPLQAFGSGLKTGAKANVNALSGAIVSTATIGMVEEFDLLAVTVGLSKSFVGR